MRRLVLCVLFALGCESAPGTDGDAYGSADVAASDDAADGASDPCAGLTVIDLGWVGDIDQCDERDILACDAASAYSSCASFAWGDNGLPVESFCDLAADLGAAYVFHGRGLDHGAETTFVLGADCPAQ